MYAEFIEQFHGYPQVVLAPEKPGPADGVITVTPLHLNKDTGKYDISPTVDANVHLRSMTPDHAAQWAQVISTASSIAQRQPAPWFTGEILRACSRLWLRVDELMKIAS